MNSAYRFPYRRRSIPLDAQSLCSIFERVRLRRITSNMQPLHTFPKVIHISIGSVVFVVVAVVAFDDHCHPLFMSDPFICSITFRLMIDDCNHNIYTHSRSRMQNHSPHLIFATVLCARCSPFGYIKSECRRYATQTKEIVSHKSAIAETIVIAAWNSICVPACVFCSM